MEYPSLDEITAQILREVARRGGSVRPKKDRNGGENTYDSLAKHFGLGEGWRADYNRSKQGSTTTRWEIRVQTAVIPLKDSGLIHGDTEHHGTWELTERGWAAVRQASGASTESHRDKNKRALPDASRSSKEAEPDCNKRLDMITGKSNNDGSYSVAIPVDKLLLWSFVDFYDDETGSGYQRLESMRRKRGGEIAKYIARCVKRRVPPRLFELTANARVRAKDIIFERLDPLHPVGILTVPSDQSHWLSIIDGGTRRLGLEIALEDGVIGSDFLVDVRLFKTQSLAEEIAEFLLINEKQKRVRTDLSLRVVQRLLDEGALTDEQNKVLRTVVPEDNTWHFDASRIAGRMNRDADSPWVGLIKMPNASAPKPVRLQAFLSSLQPLLKDQDLTGKLEAIADTSVGADAADDLIVALLKNFWNAVARANPEAHEEPHTAVLFGSIGVSACHLALGPILTTILNSEVVDFSIGRFQQMIEDSEVANYPFWFSRAGKKRDSSAYPHEKGEATRMTGGANYVRLGKSLEQSWRASLHSKSERKTVVW